jgi:hypothetical protein
MNIVNALDSTLKEYGSVVKVCRNEETFETIGFIQPINYRTTTNDYVYSEDISARENAHYLFIGCADHILMSGDKLWLDDVAYNVLRSEKYIYQNKTLYIRAILILYFPNQEDDFSGTSN